MATIQLEDAIKFAAADAFWALRGKAIQAYANLEQSLAMLFGVLAGTDRETANIIFFKVTNADARNKIIEKLFQKKFEAKYSLFRNSLLKHLGPIDRERNEVVHWNVINQVSADADGKTTSVLTMMPPATWTDVINAPRKGAGDLIDFAVKCDFFSRLIGMFSFYAQPPPDVPADTWKDWIGLFEQPVEYPPPDGHPLRVNPDVFAGPNHFHIGA